MLESSALSVRLRAAPRTAIAIAALWGLALAAFSMVHAYPLALTLLLMAGFLELSFGSMAQALVQLNAPAAIRSRVIGLFNMSSLGMRTFSGVRVGLVGGLTGVHWSLFGSALAMFGTALWLRSRTPALVSVAPPSSSSTPPSASRLCSTRGASVCQRTDNRQKVLDDSKPSQRARLFADSEGRCLLLPARQA